MYPRFGLLYYKLGVYRRWSEMMANGNGNGNGKQEVLRANSFFTCGWKPFLSWVCVFSVFWITCMMPIINSICQLKGIAFQLPSSTDMPLGEVLMAAFGLGGIHTYDRSKGIIGPKVEVQDDNKV